MFIFLVVTTVTDDFTLSSSNTVSLSSTTPATGECITINVESDLLVEGNENVILTLSSAIGTVQISDARGSAILTIGDDEGWKLMKVNNLLRSLDFSFLTTFQLQLLNLEMHLSLLVKEMLVQ